MTYVVCKRNLVIYICRILTLPAPLFYLFPLFPHPQQHGTLSAYDFELSNFESIPTNSPAPSLQELNNLQLDEISITQPGPTAHVNPPSSQLQVASCSGRLSPSISCAFPSPSYPQSQFTYSKIPSTCEVNPTLPPPPHYSASVTGILSPAMSPNPAAPSSFINGDPTTRHHIPQEPLQYHLHESLLPQLVPACSVSKHQPGAVLQPPPLISELHSPACSSFAPLYCSFSDSSASFSSPDILWWPSSHHVNTSTTSAGPFWSAPPLLVAGRPAAFTYSPGTPGPLSFSISPSCMPPPLVAPPSGTPREPVGQLPLCHFDAGVTMSTWPLRSVDYFETAPQQRRMACPCPNCASGANSKATNPDGSPRKKQHNCYFPNCSKVYSSASKLQVHLRWHLRSYTEWPFICHWLYCDKRFTRSDELLRHQGTHTDLKQFVCAECGKHFKYSVHLRQHFKTHQKLQEKEAGGGLEDSSPH